MEWSSAENKEANVFTIPESWLHLHYYEALNILFRMENSLRVFVYLILKNKHFENWDQCQIQAEGESTSIRSVAQKRISQAQGFGYLGYDINVPLMFLNSGELTRLILSDTYWAYFKTYFKGKRDIISNKLEEIGSIRNSLAHFRPLRKDDVELVKQNIRHTFIGIESSIERLLNTTSIVPTNTDSEWYKTLNTIGSDTCKVALLQSVNAEWIRIRIEQNCPVISESTYNKEYAQYNVLRLKSSAIVSKIQKIQKFCTFCDEQVSSPRKTGQETPKFTKYVSLTFSRDCIEEHYLLVAEGLREFLDHVEKESALIQQDNLATGEFVENGNCSAILRDGPNDSKIWRVQVSAITNPVVPTDPVEYWGTVSHHQSEFVTKTASFPWMPVMISSVEFPF
jgi:hypothetical protein